MSAAFTEVPTLQAVIAKVNTRLMEGEDTLALHGHDLSLSSFRNYCSSKTRFLVLDKCNIQRLDLKDLPALEWLQLTGCTIKTLKIRGDFPVLKHLEIGNGSIESMELSFKAKELKLLRLAKNKGAAYTLDLESFPKLRFAYLDSSPLQAFTIPEDHPLEILSIRETPLAVIPRTLLKTALVCLYTSGMKQCRNVPMAFLEEEGKGDGSWTMVRLWLQELEQMKGMTEPNRRVKLLLLGNGGVGKTTTLCALQQKEQYCPHDVHDSTHGIQLVNWTQDEVQFKVWDFGGQEIFHHTHRLFMSRECVQVILVNQEQESKAGTLQPDRIHKDIHFFVHPLEYWLQMAGASEDKALLLAQNSFADEGVIPSLEAMAEKLKVPYIWFNAKEDVAELSEALVQKAKDLPFFGMEMPKTWLDVCDWLETNLRQEVPERFISRKRFEELCSELKMGVDTAIRALLLRYLEFSGFVHKVQDDLLLIDMRWALDGIYALLDRNGSFFKEYYNTDKVIYHKDVLAALGNLPSHTFTSAEITVLLDYMRQCDLYIHLFDKEGKERSDEYIFFDLLPTEPPTAIGSLLEGSMDTVVRMQMSLPWPDRGIVRKAMKAFDWKLVLGNMWRGGFKIDLVDDWILVRFQCAEDKKSYLEVQFSDASIFEKYGQSFIAIYYEYSWEVAEGIGQFQALDKKMWQDASKESKNIDRFIGIFELVPLETAKIGEDEFRGIHRQIQRMKFYYPLSFEPKSRTEFFQIIKEKHFEVIHLIGHGSNRKFHFRHGDKQDPINEEEFVSYFKRDRSGTEKFIFINACFSDTLACLLSESGILCLGFEDAINDSDARIFATDFYRFWHEVKYDTRQVAEAMKKAGAYRQQHFKKARLYQNGIELLHTKRF